MPRKSHGWRSLVGCSPWGHEESDITERLHFHFSLSRIGEGNGNPLQCSCLENPGTGEPGGLPSLGSHRVGHDWSDSATAAAVLLRCHFSPNWFKESALFSQNPERDLWGQTGCLQMSVMAKLGPVVQEWYGVGLRMGRWTSGTE